LIDITSSRVDADESKFKAAHIDDIAADAANDFAISDLNLVRH
jgi:hypothetical protein